MKKVKPKRGDRVQLRGRVPYGTLVKMDEENKWVTVEWLGETKGPGLVHLDELEVIRMYPDDGGLKEPVRSYDETFGAAALLHEMFFKRKE